MKKAFSLTVLVLLVVFISAFPAEACWVYLSTEEMVEQSDLIVIGEIKGVSEKKKVKSFWMTYWEVKVHYFLKGDPDKQVLKVATPGAENREPKVSLEYRLGRWGDTVLLFLVMKDGCHEPLSPQGVVALKINDIPPGGQTSGEYLLSKYSIVDQKTMEEDIKGLERYIAGLPQVLAPAEQGAGTGKESLPFHLYIPPAALLCLALAGLVAVLKKKQRPGN